MDAPKKPNILWITFEDTSPRFGCYGDPVARTPNIDRLAKEGIRYDQAFSVAGVCAPSRSAVMTGMYPTSYGAHHMRTNHTNRHIPELPTPYQAVPPHYAKILPEYLRAAGYYTCNNDKTDYQFQTPFTAWNDCSRAAHWRNRADDQPFFAVFNNTRSHESGMWESGGMWPDRNPDPNLDTSAVDLPPYLPDPPRTRQVLSRLYANIHDNDAWAGEILSQLEEDGELENTIIVFWSDHGEGLPRAKRWPYDAGIRVPLIMRLPDQARSGQVEDRLVSLIDLAPTVLSLAGIETPAHLQGVPFAGPQTQDRAHIFAMRDRYDESYDMVRATRDERYKYIRHYYPNTPYLQWIPYHNRHPVYAEMLRLKEADRLDETQMLLFGNRPAEELYDTHNDPHELTNLAPDPRHASTLQRLRDTLDTWRGHYDTYGDMDESRMVALWRENGATPRTTSPLAIPVSPDNPGIEPSEARLTVTPATEIQLYCATQGASIGYTFEEDQDATWHLYTGSFRLPAHTTLLRVKAIRIGFEESAEAAYSIQPAAPSADSNPVAIHSR